MKREVPGSCPMCGGEITVTEIKCKKCKSVIQGEFDLCKFCRLNDKQILRKLKKNWASPIPQ